MRRDSGLLCCAIVLGGLVARTEATDDVFESRIRPLLIKHCYECHGADEAQGKLRLDTKSGWQRGGKSGPALVPGDPSSSLLIQAVTYQDPKLKMPPPDSGGRLSDREIADLVAWVRAGASDPRTDTPIAAQASPQDHWAFQPVQLPSVPRGRHPIDTLIEQRLRRERLGAVPRADRRTLVRRMTFDLHGLPPTAEQRETPLTDLPALVDRLLDSPRYGERWARHWLDVARYADAKDGVLMYGDARIRPFAYTYRDYVIRAFNTDKPFDRFIREQLAADKMGLDEHAPDLAAMGLLTVGRMFDRNRHDIIDDQIDTITRGFLGLTVSCARCHDHKFDPIPTADYYSLYGVFASSVEPYDRPRIGPVTEAGKAYEQALTEKLQEVLAQRRTHYQQTLRTARDRTPDYLVHVATTKPDISETSSYFLSLVPDQLRPQIVHRWRKLIARRAHADDPVFGPWHDLMRSPELRVRNWKQRGVDSRVIDGLVDAQPRTAQEIARTYGRIIRDVWAAEIEIDEQLDRLRAARQRLDSDSINLSEVMVGDGGSQGHAIDPLNGEITKRGAGFVDIQRHDKWISVPGSPFVDGIFIPKSGTSQVSSTGLKIGDLPVTSGKTWDYFRYGPSGGSTVTTIDNIDYNQTPNWLLALHANKGITFDLQALREQFLFGQGRLQAVLGHGGAQGQSTVDFFVYLDGTRVYERQNFRAQQPGALIDLALPETVRFLTLVVTEAGQGLSHDQAVLGNPRIVPHRPVQPSVARRRMLADLRQREQQLIQQRGELAVLERDPLGSLLLSTASPVWFPIHKTYYYLSRQEKDAFRGLVNQIDSLSVKGQSVPARAMIMRDDSPLYDPVIFQRGDPTQPGTPVPRRFLEIGSPAVRIPFTRGSGRLDLADAIASSHNPLTARVWANRVWMHHVGESLVENPSDFGLRTPRPVQHRLLDYLAATLVRSGWKTKPLHRLIMTSAAYQRASRWDNVDQFRKQSQRDPANQFLWRGHRRRLDLEQMRDSVLMVSGQLDLTMYGRPGAINDLEFRRRTIYTFAERQNIPDVVSTFDAANPDSSTARRVFTTVPQQALFAMNSPFMDRAARLIADQSGDRNVAERLNWVFTVILGRKPTADELAMGTEFVKNGSWKQMAHILLMTNEMMFID